ncbi:MAG: T9SS type A sorting domain-containing protein [Haliscomenobacter sp.]|nr:T9SS type A sorting domain-containing protein [Haliscomenobacter sp.]
MRRPLLTFAGAILLAIPLLAQFDFMNYRTIDGRNNNLTFTEWGAAHTRMPRMVGAFYSDGVSSPAGVSRPNPREISNAIFAQPGVMSEPLHLSDFTWVFGQFLDHDFGLTPDTKEPLMINVPVGDVHFDPLGTGKVVIPMARNVFDPATGTGPGNPREHVNVITSFIDGSNVYGSDDERANWLRSFKGGKLKVSKGNMMPYNTVNNEYDGEVDPTAPPMANPIGRSKKLYVAGDERANENALLASVHTLFVREHNRLCDELAKAHPDWTDEQLYQQARKINSGIIQSIVYNEWLPTLRLQLPAYEGYKPEVDPSAMNEFTGAAFRLGHTLLNGTLRRILTTGELHPEGHIALRDAFFNVEMLEESGGLDVFFQGMGTQVMQTFDAKVVDDVRNFLFGPPGAGGLDLAAININRGRERGLPDFNTMRKAMGLTPYIAFQQMHKDPRIYHTLLRHYRKVNNIDLWVGLLVEQRGSGELFAPTLKEILKRQFTAFRDGDRFFYEADPVLTDEEKTEIRNTAFHDVIMRNTSMKMMQDHVFEAMSFDLICGDLAVNVSGKIETETGTPLYNTTVMIGMESGTMQSTSGTDGGFNFDGVPSCSAHDMLLAKEDDFSNGVNIMDLIKMFKHILGDELLDSPYKMLAADLDGSGSISLSDMIAMQRLILGQTNTFPNADTPWRFVPADFVFDDPHNPFASDMPEGMHFDLPTADVHQDFVAYKLGDLNNSASAGAQALAIAPRSAGDPLHINVQDLAFQAGDRVRVAFRAADLSAFQGYQFALSFDPEALGYESLQSGAIPNLNKNNFGVFAADGAITTLWSAPATAVDAQDATLFTLEFVALKAGKVSDYLILDRRQLRAEAYDLGLNERPLALNFQSVDAANAASLEVYQNRPNPFDGETLIPFRLPESGQATLRVFDAAGRQLLQRSAAFDAGNQEWTISGADLPGTGLYFYRLETSAGAVTRKMIRR